jgi:hypothetical protein
MFDKNFFCIYCVESTKNVNVNLKLFDKNLRVFVSMSRNLFPFMSKKFKLFGYHFRELLAAGEKLRVFKLGYVNSVTSFILI